MSTEQNKRVFLITKPLQMLISLLIMQSHGRNEKAFFALTRTFRDAEGVAARISERFTDRITIKYFDNQRLAYNWIASKHFTEVFIDSDFGFQNFLKLARFKMRCRNTRINVYEEGVGSYRNDFHNGIKSLIFNFLGIGSNFGASRYTDQIFLLQPDEYCQKFPNLSGKVRSITSDLKGLLSDEMMDLNFIFDFHEVTQPSARSDGLCRLYLSNWNIDWNFLNTLKKKTGDIYFKPHPHIIDPIYIDGVSVIGINAPAELVVLELLKKYDLVEVFDHFSSTRRYITDSRLTYYEAVIDQL